MGGRPASAVLLLGLVGAAGVLPSPQAAGSDLLIRWSGSPTRLPAEQVLSATTADASAVAAWSLLTWLTLTLAIVLAARLPGAAGRLADSLGGLVAPAALRRALGLVLGLGLTVPGAGPALAAVPSPTPSTVVLEPDWQSAPLPTGVGDLPEAPVVAAPPTGAPALTSTLPPVVTPTVALPLTPTPAEAPRTVVVRPGDCLWSLAAAHLPREATAEQVAAAWPTWWAANRTVIGADPDLIHPGDVLRVPDPPS